MAYQLTFYTVVMIAQKEEVKRIRSIAQKSLVILLFNWNFTLRW